MSDITEGLPGTRVILTAFKIENPDETDMKMPATRLLDFHESEDYVEESTHLLCAAETRLSQLHQRDLCEAERLLAAEIVEAMRRIHGLLQDHRTRAARISPVRPVRHPLAARRRWWPLVRRERARRAPLDP